jgi:hypothetical protein
MDLSIGTVAPSPPLPAVGRVLTGVGGYVALGAVAQLGDPAHAALSVMFGALAAALGTVAFTLPTLLVAHPWLGLRTDPMGVAARQIEGFTRCGRLAGTLAPVMLFFVFAQTATQVLYVLAVGCIGIAGLLAGGMEIAEAETGTQRAVAKHVALGWMLVGGWAGLVLLTRLLPLPTLTFSYVL